MPSLEPLDQRLRRRKADQRVGHEALAGPGVGGSILDVPGAGRVDGEDGLGGVAERCNDGGEGLADFAGEGEAWWVVRRVSCTGRGGGGTAQDGVGGGKLGMEQGGILGTEDGVND